MKDKWYYHDSEPVAINQDLPHLRNGGKWKDPKTKQRAESYLGWLKALKMSDADAQCLIGDIYWDCHTELTLAEHGLLQAEHSHKRPWNP